MVASMSMQPIHPRSSTPFAAALSADWDRVVASSAARRALRSWPLPSLAVACRDLDELVAAAGHGRPLDDTDADRVLHELVTLAADDDLAARVVLQRVLPALLAAASRRAGANHHAQQLALEELTASALIFIRTYPVARRPSRVASKHRPRQRVRRVRPPPPPSLRRRGAGRPRDDRRGVRRAVVRRPLAGELRAVGRGAPGCGDAGACPEDVRFAAGLASGWSTARLASEFGICQRSVRNRRATVVAQIRAMQRDEAAA